jgi:PilZ domain
MRPRTADDSAVTNTFTEVESPTALVTGFSVRLEAGGVSAVGRVLSVGLRVRVALTSGADALRGAADDAPVSLEFGGSGSLHVGDSEIIRWEDDTTVVLARPLAYSVWQRLVHPSFRVRLLLTVVLGGINGVTLEGETIELSASGTLCYLPDVDLAIGALLDLSLALPDGDLITRAEVIGNGTMHRLRFVNLTKADFTRLVRFCRADQTWTRTIVV